MLMQNCGVTKKEHYGMFGIFWSGQLQFFLSFFTFLFSPHLVLNMYSIYVTNKSGIRVYIRVQQQKISSANPRFCDDLYAVEHGRVRGGGTVTTYLLQWGFCEIAPDQTITFAVDITNEGPRKYASLYAGYKLCTVDFEINCLRYGCLFVKKVRGNDCYGRQEVEYFFYQANPQPVWIPVEDGHPLPKKIIKAGTTGFGRSPGNGEKPLKVILARSGCQFTTIYSKGLSSREPSFRSGTCLSDTGHEFVPANTGDPVPPHAVIGGVSVPEGSLYLGRVGGNTPCVIEVERGKVKSFCYGPMNKVQSGEILTLTNDPKV